MRSRIPFQFVLEELLPARPVIKKMFGFSHFYLGERLVCSLRESVKQPATNGMWVYTTVDQIDNLWKEFPDLPRRNLWRSGKNGWVVLSSRHENFEDYALRACALIVAGDRRIGRITRGSLSRLNEK